MHAKHWSRLPGSALHNIMKSQRPVFNKAGWDDTILLATWLAEERSQTVLYLFNPPEKHPLCCYPAIHFRPAAVLWTHCWLRDRGWNLTAWLSCRFGSLCWLENSVYLINNCLSSVLVSISRRSGFLLWIHAPWHQWRLGTWQHGRCEDLLQNLGDLLGIHGNKRPTCW